MNVRSRQRYLQTSTLSNYLSYTMKRALMALMDVAAASCCTRLTSPSLHCCSDHTFAARELLKCCTIHTLVDIRPLECSLDQLGDALKNAVGNSLQMVSLRCNPDMDNKSCWSAVTSKPHVFSATRPPPLSKPYSGPLSGRCRADSPREWEAMLPTDALHIARIAPYDASICQG